MLPSDQDSAEAEQAFLAKIGESSFPCLGAKAAMGQGNLQVLSCWNMASGWDDMRVHAALLDWAEEYRNDPDGLRSLVVIFQGPLDLSEEEFEALMWERIQSFADKDAWLGQVYDDSVSPDPDDPHFSLSFGGESFFVVGLHPAASRPARRFAFPALVFNLHAQFERLRAEGRYEKFREKIIVRDIELAGSPNPMLARHGDASEAPQYSGREVDADWECPFRDPRTP